MQKSWNTTHLEIDIWETLIHNIKEALGLILINLQQIDNSSNSGYARIQEDDIQNEIWTIIARLINNCQLNGASEVIPTLVRYYFLASLLKDPSMSTGAYISQPDSTENDEDGYYSAIEELKKLQSSLIQQKEQYSEFSDIISQAISMSSHLVDQWKRKVGSVMLRK